MDNNVLVNNTCKRRKVSDEKEMGRSTLKWKDRAERTKRQDVAVLCDYLKDFPTEMVVGAFIKFLKESKVESNKNLSKLLKHAINNPTKIDKMISTFNSVSKPFIPLNPCQALGLLLDANLSKRQYLKVREAAAFSEKSVFPSYERVRLAKLECRPPLEYATITEISASYTLECLSTYTTERIIKMQKDVIIQNQNAMNVKSEICEMIFSCGCDGSSGQQNYKQKYKSFNDLSSNYDSAIFATTLIPLRLHNASRKVYWNNNTPQSVRFCRPLKIMFAKETKELIMNEKKLLQEQIKKLKYFTVDLGNGHSVTVKFEFYLTIIDGKVLAVFTNTTSAQSCPICGCNPKNFNVKENLMTTKFAPKPGSLMYGISPLHCYIRGLEWLLHLSYKIKINKWQARSESDKENVRSRKKVIQETLWEKLGLRVDFPNSTGSGTSNDGNTARRAFQNFKQFAEILEIDIDIVYRFRIVLLSLNCQLPIDADKFKLYCTELYLKYVELYEWYKLPASIHKVLVHGSEIINASSLPVGMLGEEGAEARNKLYKNDRNMHARKNSRLNTMTDVFFRAIDSSDPAFSSQSLSARLGLKSKRETLSSDVIKLLKVPQWDTDCDEPLANFDEIDSNVSIVLNDMVLTSELSNEDDI